MPYVEKNYRVLTDRANTRDRRPVDGRQPDAAGRHPAAREVRLHRRLQLRSARRRAGGWPRRRPRGTRCCRAGSSRGTAGARRAAATLPNGNGCSAAKLDDAEPEEGAEGVLVRTGKDDGLMHDDQGDRGALQEARLQRRSSRRAPGGHTWINWRDYLTEFVPQLFQAGAPKAGTAPPASR